MELPGGVNYYFMNLHKKNKSPLTWNEKEKRGGRINTENQKDGRQRLITKKGKEKSPRLPL